MREFAVLLGYGLRDQVRNRWIIAYGLFFFVVGVVLLQFGTDYRRYLASMASIVLFLNPAVSILYTAVYWYSSASFRQLILVQPVSRRVVFLSSWVSILLGLSGAFVIGSSAPLIFFGKLDQRMIVLFAMGLLLITVFTLLGVFWAAAQRDRMKGLAGALSTWLYLAIIHDGLVLGLLLLLRDYPVEKLAFLLLGLNPVDLSRLYLLFSFDLAALMGYTGSILEQMVHSGSGALILSAGILLWVAIPGLAAERLFRRKDF
jgi:Cu-processing system permease protein